MYRVNAAFAARGPPPSQAAAPPVSGLVSTPHNSGQGGQSRRKPVGKREHCSFVSFERDLLGEHHIASYQGRFGNETPPDLRLSFFVELQNVAHRPLENSISPPRVRACHFEITIGIKLRSLLWGQPFPQKPPPACVRAVLLDEAPIKLTQGTQPRIISVAAVEQKHCRVARLSRRRGADRIASHPQWDQMTV